MIKFCICFAIVPTKLDLGVVAAPLGSFRAFKIMSLLEIMGMLKVTSSTNDVISTSLFIEVFDSIGPYILLIINKSLAKSCVSL